MYPFLDLRDDKSKKLGMHYEFNALTADALKAELLKNKGRSNTKDGSDKNAKKG